MTAYDVYLGRKNIDTVFYGSKPSGSNRIERQEDVRRSLINHDGYDSDIVVRERREKKIEKNARRGLRRNAGGSLDIKKIKTIDIYGKLWRDKTYGNTYFASRAVINFGMPSEQEIFYPYQYGYGNSYSDIPLDDIMARAGIEQRMRSGWRLRDEYGIILRQGSEYAKKAEVKAFGEGR